MIKFAKVRDVKSPARANPEDAGVDFFVPSDLTLDVLIEKGNFGRVSVKEEPVDIETLEESKEQLVHGTVTFSIKPHSRVLIPSGIHVKIDDGWALVAANKSGVATKKGLVYSAQIVDSTYMGEVHLGIINTTDEWIDFQPGDKILQFLYLPVGLDIPEEVNFDDLYTTNTNRGSGGFGSTGDK